MKKMIIKLKESNIELKINYYWRPNLESKNTLLILPGLDESINDYQNFFQELKGFLPQYSLLAIDLRGQGITLESEKNIDSEEIKLDEQLEIIKYLINQLQIKNFAVLGLSYGAGIALYMANRIKIIDGLFLLAPYVSNFKSYQGGIIGAWYSLGYMNPFLKSLSKVSLPFYFQLASAKKEFSQIRPDALAKLSLGIMELETAQEAKKLLELKKGVHLLIGNKDKLVPLNAVEQLFKQFHCQYKTLTILPDTGHRLLINNHSVCAEWLSKILA